MKELYYARCSDLQIEAKDRQCSKFISQCSEMCVNRKLRLEKMFLGTKTAALIAKWLIENSVDITHLLMSHNNLMDEGVFSLA